MADPQTATAPLPETVAAPPDPGEPALRLALDACAEAMVVADAEGTVRLVNDAFARLTGWTADRLDGRGGLIAAFVSRSQLAEALASATSTPAGEWRGEAPLARGDGGAVVAAVRVLALRSPECSSVVGYAVAATPLGPLAVGQESIRNLEFALQTIEAQARALDAHRVESDGAHLAKHQFLANISHEVRTPMMALFGAAERIAAAGVALGPALADAVVEMRRHGGRLLSMLDDMIDYNALESGHLTLESGPVPLPELLADALKAQQPAASDKEQMLRLRWEGPVPAMLPGDAGRLRRVLAILLDNAVKFTPAGGQVAITATVRPVARAEPLPRFQVDIDDSGPGIEPEVLLKLFQPFTQADASLTRRFGGIGLGLAFARALVHRMGGRMHARSRPGRGCTFRVSLPFEPDRVAVMVTPTPLTLLPAAAAVPAAPIVLSSGSPQRLLIVEDSPEVQRVLSFHLGRAGLECVPADDGAAGVAAAVAALEQGRPFDAIIMDMQMPVMDGYAAVRALRARGLATPILALTAHAQPGDRERCLAAGCDDYAAKPIDPFGLTERVGRLLDRLPAARAAWA